MVQRLDNNATAPIKGLNHVIDVGLWSFQGGNAGKVTVENAGSILTTGEAAYGINASSIGAGAGSGSSSGGIYAVWYPIKNHDAVQDFRRRLAESSIADVIDIRLELRPPSSEPRLDGTGMIVVNPPWTLRPNMESTLPDLLDRLQLDSSAHLRIEQLAEE